MARTRKKAKTLWWAVSRLFFILLLLSMLAAYISNQVTISSKQAELDALNEQIAQQQSENEELERIRGVDRPGLLRLRGPQRADHCGHLGQLTRPFAAGAAPELHSMAEYEGVSEKSNMLGYSPKSAGCKAHERRTPPWNASECNAADGAFW